ncbi:MAG: ABC transporter permease [Desulfovibrio sp.]|jgi:ABC-2 type transport system permease protein|nr:ABC transporter permease [Desulfovibrio sp.]
MIAHLRQSLRRIATIVRKELLVQLYNKTSRLMLIVPPLAQIVIFGWAATMEVRNVDVAVLNHDGGSWSQKVLHGLRGSPTTFRDIRHAQSEKEIGGIVERGDALVALVFPSDFSARIARGDPAVVQTILDGRRANAAQIVTYYLQDIVDDVASGTIRDQARDALMPKLDIEVRSWFNPNLEFQWFFLPNLIGMLSFMLGLVVTGLSVAREREVGTFDQLLVSPATPAEIALAKLVPGCIIGLVHGTIFLLISIFGFGVPFTGAVALLYISMLIFAAAAGGIGLMVSSLSSTQQQAFLGAFTIGVPCILISGAVTPVVNMPPFLQYASDFNPVCHFVAICQGLFLKDMGLAATLSRLWKIALISSVTVTVAIFLFRRRT